MARIGERVIGGRVGPHAEVRAADAGEVEIAGRMTGRLEPVDATGRMEAVLPSPAVQNHAAFLHRAADGTLFCAWFGGTIEGAADIAIRLSRLAPGATVWDAPATLSDDAARSEQNPVLFAAPSGDLVLVHTAQTAGAQDRCLLRRRAVSAGATVAAGPAATIDLPRGTFVRAPLVARDDGALLMPVFRCIAPPGRRWDGSHDVAGVAVSGDGGATWALEDVPGSVGCVHMTIVPGPTLTAYYRRRQADHVHRSESRDGGRTWSVPAPTDVPNNNSSIGAVRLRDGRIALLCNPVSAATSPDRRASLYDELDAAGVAEGDEAGAGAPAGEGCVPIWGVPRAPLALCISEDDGRTFPLRRVVANSAGTCLSNNSVDGRNKELSYPVLSEAADGSLDLAFTYHRRAIKHVRLPPGWLDAAPSEAADGR